jgi:hypothetical protein
MLGLSAATQSIPFWREHGISAYVPVWLRALPFSLGKVFENAEMALGTMDKPCEVCELYHTDRARFRLDREAFREAGGTHDDCELCFLQRGCSDEELAEAQETERLATRDGGDQQAREMAAEDLWARQTEAHEVLAALLRRKPRLSEREALALATAEVWLLNTMDTVTRCIQAESTYRKHHAATYRPGRPRPRRPQRRGMLGDRNRWYVRDSWGWGYMYISLRHCQWWVGRGTGLFAIGDGRTNKGGTSDGRAGQHGVWVLLVIHCRELKDFLR